MRPQAAKTQSPAQALLEKLLEIRLILREDWDALPPQVRGEISNIISTDRLQIRLGEERLLTPFQAAMVGAGKVYSLVMGTYRILDRLGVGDMAVIFRAEHVQTRQEVAVKVLAPTVSQDPSALLRFFTERKTIAQLRHPNIVNILDIGETVTPDPDTPKLYYYVMEHIPGLDLEAFVQKNGPLPAPRACEIACHVASALAEAHAHNLIHRDISPANILVTDDGKVRLLDFGLVRHHTGRVTQPGTQLGSFDFMAPEQASDASAVDLRADIFSLGATLFWCLTAKMPYAFLGPRVRDLSVRLTAPVPAPSTIRSEVPATVDAVVLRMMALKPEDRFATAQDVIKAMEPLLPPGSDVYELGETKAPAPPPAKPAGLGPAITRTAMLVLVVDPDEAVRDLCVKALGNEAFICEEAASGKQALEAASARPPDVVVLSEKLPDQPGLAVLRQIRQKSPFAHLKAILLTGGDPRAVKQVLAAGADDYLAKPLDPSQLQSRFGTLLQLKEAQDRVDQVIMEVVAQRAAEAAAKAAAAAAAAKPKPGLLGRIFGKH